MFEVGDRVQCVLNPEVEGVIVDVEGLREETQYVVRTNKPIIPPWSSDLWAFFPWQLRKVEPPEERDWFVVGKSWDGYLKVVMQDMTEAQAKSSENKIYRAFRWPDGVQE